MCAIHLLNGDETELFRLFFEFASAANQEEKFLRHLADIPLCLNKQIGNRKQHVRMRTRKEIKQFWTD